MTMIRPIGVDISAFDSTSSQLFEFVSTGGNQIVKNRIIIRNNSTGAVIYDNTLVTYSLNQTVPAHTLTNGIQYNFTFTTYDIDGNSSLESVPVVFRCYTTPSLVFTNLVANQKVQSSTYVFMAQYTQTQNEYLKYANFTLYNSANSQIYKSADIDVTTAPPNSLSLSFNQLDNNTNYFMEVSGVTVNGTITNSGKIPFNVTYTQPILYNVLALENKCGDGYNQITSNFLVIEGETNPSTPRYINNIKLDIIKYLEYVKWLSGFSIKKDFVFTLWYGVAFLGKQFVIKKDNSNYFIGNWVREIPYGETAVKDYIEITGYINNIETFYMRSNYINIINNTANLVLWFKFNPLSSTYELILSETDNVVNTLVWNTTSNAEYGRMTDLSYVGEETYPIGINKPNVFGDMSSIYPITDIELYNGVYDNIDISCKVTKTYSVDKPIWDYCTMLNCNFNNNVNGGNVNIILSQLSSIKIKSKEKGTYVWNTLKEIPVSTSTDLSFSFQDFTPPCGIDIEYAIVPVLIGNIEGDYIINELDDIVWDKIFVCDKDNIFSLYASATYNDLTDNVEIGQLQPIGSKYPILIKNSNIDYESGGISAQLFDDSFETTRVINSKAIVDKRNAWNTFIKNGKAKIIKDWNGNIWLARVNASTTSSFMQQGGNEINTVSFSFVEQGKWNNQTDLTENGII